MLEEAVTAAKGAVKMVKLNIDEAQNITGQLQIQSIPTLGADRTITFPAVSATLATIAGTETLTNKTLTAPVIGTGLTASGSAANNFSGSTGDFLTSSGDVTLSGDVTISGSKTLTTGTGAIALNGDVTVAAGKDLILADGAGYIYVGGTTTGGIKIVAVSGGTSDLTITNPSCAAGTTITLPNATTTLSGLAIDETVTGDKVHTGTLDIRGNVSSGASDPNVDLSGSSGTFLSTTGANTLSGHVTVADGKNVTIGSATGGPATGYISIFSATASKGEVRLAQPDDTNNKITTIQANDASSNATITLPNATSTLSGIGLAETFSAVKTFSVEPVVLIDDANNTSVTDLLQLSHTSSAASGVGIGVGISVLIENDTDATTESARIDWITTNDGTKTALDTDIQFKTMLGGSLLTAILVDASAQEVQIGASASEATGLNTLRIFPHTTAARGSLVFTSAINGSGDYDTTVTQATGVSEDQTITIPDSDASTDTFDLIGTAQTVSAVKTFSATPIVHISASATNAVTDLLTLKHETDGTPAAGLGIGISFQITDLTGATVEEQASIDAVMQTVTSAAEDCALVFSQNLAGTITQTVRSTPTTRASRLAGQPPMATASTSSASTARPTPRAR